MLKKFFVTVDVKKGNFNKPIAMGLLTFDSNLYQATLFTDSGVLLHNVHSVLPA